ncbi:hypothetical protein [Olleya sp. YS]|uniref:hypothetical protein n=1 Tax=Olleya sp. YS TaxID=3028318 RepID=UPI002434153E|nr:hypothetical protein [Olleya sp. YS]WGD33905.1 hypothetical protein Ollyesu_08950 [Olleya sp. YS]
MKYVFTICMTLMSCFGLSQEILVDNNQTNAIDQTINYQGFEEIYNKLRAISEHINETTTIIKRFDEIRQGQLIVNTENLGRSFEGLQIDARPSLDVELQRIMFTGNFFNTQQRTPLIINHE